ncbi:MAG: hypothetical protein ACYTFT_05730 [Planctomycetota bacterium]
MPPEDPWQSFREEATPHRPRNPWHEKRDARPLFSGFRGVPGYSLLRALVPLQVRLRLRPRLRPYVTQPIRSRPEWDPDTRAWVAERVEPDAAQFLTHYGKPADFWKPTGAGD